MTEQAMFVDDLVSIVTPAWKAAAYVQDTVASVQMQTYGRWEMIVVDDCSPDDTAALVERLSRNDPRLRLIRQTQNGGPAAARNAALQAAKGRWIAFLDSDDLWQPEKLERQLAFQKKQGAKISYTAFRRMSGDGKDVGHLIHVPARLDYNRLLGNTALATSTVMVDRKLTGPFSMKKMFYDDFGCWLDLLRPGGEAAGLDEDLMRYRVLGGSVSRNKARSAIEVWKTYRDVEKLSLVRSCVSFARYAGNCLRKYAAF